MFYHLDGRFKDFQKVQHVQPHRHLAGSPVQGLGSILVSFVGKPGGKGLMVPHLSERRGMDQNQSWHNSLISANSQCYWCVLRFCDFCTAIPKPKLCWLWQIRQINKHGFSAINPPNLSGLNIENHIYHLGFGESHKFWEHPPNLPHLCCFNPSMFHLLGSQQHFWSWLLVKRSTPNIDVTLAAHGDVVPIATGDLKRSLSWLTSMS